MFKKSKLKIITSIMVVIILILFGTLAIIYGSSYAQVSADNQRMLKQYARQYHINYSDGNNPSDDKNTADHDIKPQTPEEPSHKVPPPEVLHKFDVSTFYSVAVSDDGTVIKISNESGTLYSDETLKVYAEEIIRSGSEKGVKDSLAYLKTEKNGYILVSFMDNAVMQGSMAMLFRNTLIFGGISIIAVLIASIFLSGRIVTPLEESYQKQKQFISDAGHELKTPVSVISTNAELLAKEIGKNKWLSNIQYENEKMGSLVTQLLELARMENAAPQTEHVDFGRLIMGELLPFESVAYEHGLQLDSDIANSIYINGDSSRLKQLVSILIDNAIRHSKNGCFVKVSLQKQHNFAKLSVINDGKEIPAEQQKHIFERFYLIDSARNGDDRHFGLGLAIAKAITASHHGEITISCHDGKIEFSVLLPLEK